MPAKLIITQDENDDFYLEEEFTADIIQIGRDNSSDVAIQDKNKFVSRKHAQIQFQDGSYYLMDQESRNGTFLNHKRLKANYPYTLEDGTEFEIGQFHITFRIVEEKQASPEPPVRSSDRTMVFANPFEEEATALVDTLKRMEEKYTRGEMINPDEQLQSALQDAVSSIENFTVTSKLRSNFGLNGTHSSASGSSAAAVNTGSLQNGTDRVLDLLLDLSVKLFDFIAKFRIEFVGSTMIQSEGDLPYDSAESLKQYLFDSTISSEEQDKRFKKLKTESRRLISHQVGLLEGYKESVKKGMPEILREVSPAIVQNDIANSSFRLGPIKIPAKFIPLYSQMKTLKVLKENHFEIVDEDKGFFEKKFFRPPFIKKYLETASYDGKR